LQKVVLNKGSIVIYQIPKSSIKLQREIRNGLLKQLQTVVDMHRKIPNFSQQLIEVQSKQFQNTKKLYNTK